MATPAYRSEFIESFKAEGRAEGKAEGRAEGKAEGQVQALVSAIMKTLAARGIQVAKSRTEQVQSCTDLDQLNAWFEAALTAKTADDVFSPEIR
jgi:predicted transposase YdaD